MTEHNSTGTGAPPVFLMQILGGRFSDTEKAGIWEKVGELRKGAADTGSPYEFWRDSAHFHFVAAQDEDTPYGRRTFLLALAQCCGTMAMLESREAGQGGKP